MKSYLIRITTAAIMAVFADILSPKGWKKYTSIITGLLLLVVLIEPATTICNVDLLEDYTSVEEETEAGNRIYSDMMKKEFSKKLSEDIQTRIFEEFSNDVSVDTEIDMDDKGNLLKIRQIVIHGNGLTDKIKERISYVYDVDEVILSAN